MTEEEVNKRIDNLIHPSRGKWLDKGKYRKLAWIVGTDLEKRLSEYWLGPKVLVTLMLNSRNAICERFHIIYNLKEDATAPASKNNPSVLDLVGTLHIDWTEPNYDTCFSLFRSDEHLLKFARMYLSADTERLQDFIVHNSPGSYVHAAQARLRPSGFDMISCPTKFDDIRESLEKHGPLLVGFGVGEEFMEVSLLQHRGRVKECSRKEKSHAMVVVGGPRGASESGTARAFRNKGKKEVLGARSSMEANSAPSSKLLDEQRVFGNGFGLL